MTHLIAALRSRRGFGLAAACAVSLACFSPSPATAQALSLTEAQRLAQHDAPGVVAQEAAVRAARDASVASTELPDPKLTLGVENLPVDGSERFSLERDFMTMRKIGVMQDFVRADKRRLRGERAQAEVDKEVAVLAVAEVNLRRDVAIAWIDVWAAERELAVLHDLEREAGLAISAAQAALAGGKGRAADPFSSEVASAQIADRMIDARRAVTKARAQLARWIGDDAARSLAAPPDFTRIVHHHDQLVGALENHPHLAMYAPMEAMADADVALAEAAKRPDWSVELAYAQRGPLYSNMISIGVRIDLPIFEARRQNPLIASRLAAAEQVRAQAEDARRMHLADIRSFLADWAAARERVQQFETSQLPLARERSRAALADYRGGKADLAAALEARRGEVEIRLGVVRAAAEMARAWASLNFLLPAPATGEHP